MSTKKEMRHLELGKKPLLNEVKILSYVECSLLSEDIKNNILENVSANGGHLSSNLGDIDLTISLCRIFDFEKDKIIFDVGHQCYAYKLLTGRSLENLRKSNGVSGFQKRSESKYDCYEGGHSSTSISAASGFALARDLDHEDYSIIALIGDASISNGIAFEALNNLASSKHKVIIVLNDNDMAIGQIDNALSRGFRKLSNSALYRKSKNVYTRIMKSTKVGRFTLRWTSSVKNWFKRHLMAINIFDNIGITYYGPIDGHDIKRLDRALAKAKKDNESCIVHVKTIKGKGYKFAEEDKNGSWHGVGQFDISSGQIAKDESVISWSEYVGKESLSFMDKYDDAVMIVPATGLGSKMSEVFAKHPNRAIDVGINEEHAMILASGLSAANKHPIVSIYSTFLQRTYDEISHDLSRMELNATLLIDRAGLVGDDGNTHQGIYDTSFLYTIPNTVIAMPSRPNQISSLLEESKNKHGVFAIRYPRSSFKRADYEKEKVPFGKWIKEVSGSRFALVGVGPLLEDIKDYFIKNKIDATIYNAVYQRPLDKEAFLSLLAYPKIIIYDPYSTVEGFAKELSAQLLLHNYQGQVVVKSIPNVYVDHGSIEEQLKKYGLSINDIIDIL